MSGNCVFLIITDYLPCYYMTNGVFKKQAQKSSQMAKKRAQQTKKQRRYVVVALSTEKQIC